jgi:hypothetical protein
MFNDDQRQTNTNLVASIGRVWDAAYVSNLIIATNRARIHFLE